MTAALARARALLDQPPPTVLPGQLDLRSNDVTALPPRQPNGLTVLDTYCCQGGASMGYYLAGFDVVGVDLNPQPRYPFEFHQGDAVQFIRDHGADFDLIAGSPTCRRWTNAQRLRGNDHPDLITPTREAMITTGRPYIIENVEGARAALNDPLLLCGAMFGLKTYRHRLFESSLPLGTRLHPRHLAPLAKMGRPVRDGEFMHVVGNFTDADRARTVMGMPWATRDGLREAIPPAYTQFLGEQAAAQLTTTTAP
ncbi:class I SAM-dependent methyltransferase [Streptomyces rubiginosohelvolus]|uniref:SAM-dependent methyltransferase n=1 Tax=Streptomyces rubiginosohelvolus TaxID=67362 RepID=UPI003721A68E